MSDALLHQILDAVNAIAVRQGSLEARFDAAEAANAARFGKLETRFDALHARFDELDTRQDAIELRNAERHAELMGNMRRVEAKVDRVEIKADRIVQDVLDLQVRLSTADQMNANWAQVVATQSARLDRIGVRLELIERRLDIRDETRDAA